MIKADPIHLQVQHIKETQEKAPEKDSYKFLKEIQQPRRSEPFPNHLGSSNINHGPPYSIL